MIPRKLTLLTCIVAGACASGGQNPQRASTSEPLTFQADDASALDLVAAIDPENRRALLPGPDCADGARRPRTREDRRSDAVRQFECAARAFKTYHVGYDDAAAALARDPEALARAASGSVALAMRRNDVQDRMVLRSDALCDDFQRRLNVELRIENDTGLGNWLRNSQARLVGGAGALLLNSDAVWALTGASQITGLPGYVADEGQIEKATMRLATEGMRQRRAALFAGIDMRRRKASRRGGLRVPGGDGREGVTPISEYSLERAITDGIAYHRACGVGQGLAYVEEVLGANRPVPVAVSFPALDTGEAHGAEARTPQPE